MTSSSAAYTLTDCTMPLGICNWKEKIYNLVTNNFIVYFVRKNITNTLEVSHTPLNKHLRKSISWTCFKLKCFEQKQP